MVKLTKEKIFLTLGLPLSLFVISFSLNEQEHDLINSLHALLDQYNAEFHTERAYVVTDRYLYRPGETIWFQGFASSTPNDDRTSYSEDFYVKLLNQNGEEISFRRYPVSDNMVSGNLSLPRTLIPGKYYMIAYTGWMKNQPATDVFSKEILISKYFDKHLKLNVLFDKLSYMSGDTMKVVLDITDHEGKVMSEDDFEYSVETFKKELIKGVARTDDKGKAIISMVLPKSKEFVFLTVQMKRKKNLGTYTVAIPMMYSKPVVAFYPGSGKLVRDLDSKMAFRVTNKFGLPILIKGEIYNQSGEKLTDVQTNSKGLGEFSICPTGDSIYLKISYPYDIKDLYPLPADFEKGTVLHLLQKNQDSVNFELKTSHIGNESFYLVAVMDRQIMWSEKLNFKDSCNISIPLNDLKPGILQLSVFNKNGQLEADRLVNIKRSDTYLSLNANQKLYGNRHRVSFSIEYNGPSEYVDLALSVSLDQMADHPNMLSFKHVSSSKLFGDTLDISLLPENEISDLELAASDFRIINWDALQNPKERPPVFRNKDGIKGKVVDKKSNPAQLAKVRITSIPNYRLYETQTDEQGHFMVQFGSDIIDFNYLNVDAYDATGKTNLVSLINYDYSEELKEKFLAEKESINKEKINDIISYGDPNLVYALRYGSIKDRKTTSILRKNYNPYQYRDYSDVLDIIKEIRDYEMQDNTIVFLDISEEDHLPYQKNSALIVINGVSWGDQVEVLKSISPSDITNMAISDSPNDVHRYTSANLPAVIEITTIQGMYKYRKRQVQLIRDLVNPDHDFYTPDYSFESLSVPDNRKTLYWNSHIQVRRNTPAIISFYTSDVKGVFLSRAEGMDAEGNPVSADFKFTVIGE